MTAPRERLAELMPGTPEPRPPVGEVVEGLQVLASLRENARFIAAVAAGTLAAAVALTLVLSMRFTALARLYLGELEDRNQAVPQAGEDIDLSGGGRGDMVSEIEILRSRSLVTKAVLAAAVNVRLVPAGWTAPRYWRWLLARRSPGLLDVAGREVIAVDTFLADRSVTEADFTIQFDKNHEYEILASDRVIGRGQLGVATRAGGLSITLLPGGERAPGDGARYDLTVYSIDDVLEDVAKALDVTTPGGKLLTGEMTKVANLQFTDRSPRTAAAFLEHLIDGFLERRQSWKTENARAAEAFVKTQLASVQDTLDGLQQKLAEYRKNSPVIVLDNEARALAEQIGKYDEQRVETRLEVQSLADMQDALKAPNPSIESFMFGEAKDSVLMGLASSLVAAQQKLAEAEARFNDAAPEVRDQKAEMAAHLNAIQSYVSARLSRARTNLHNLDEVVRQYEDRLRTVPGAEMGLAQLSRESEVYSNMYSFLLKREQEMAITKASTISKNRVLDPVEVSYREDWPKPLLALAGLPVGFLLGAVIVVLRLLFSSRLQGGSDVKAYLGGVPVFAAVPRFPHKMAAADTAGFTTAVSQEYVEAYRTLRTNLIYACPREIGNVILITSPCSGDGKTTCARSLASSIARISRSVLLVDAGVGAPPTTGTGSSADGRDGLGAILEGHDVWRAAVRSVSVSEACRFDVIRGGGAHALGDLVSSTSMRDFVAEARRTYDFVIFDAPSYPAFSDALVLSSLADCVLSVVRPRHTSKRLAAENARRLSGGAGQFGIVINAVRA